MRTIAVLAVVLACLAAAAPVQAGVAWSTGAAYVSTCNESTFVSLFNSGDMPAAISTGTLSAGVLYQLSVQFEISTETSPTDRTIRVYLGSTVIHELFIGADDAQAGSDPLKAILTVNVHIEDGYLFLTHPSVDVVTDGQLWYGNVHVRNAAGGTYPFTPVGTNVPNSGGAALAFDIKQKCTDDVTNTLAYARIVRIA